MFGLFSSIKLQQSFVRRVLILAVLVGFVNSAFAFAARDVSDERKKTFVRDLQVGKTESSKLAALVRECNEERREIRQCLNDKLEKARAIQSWLPQGLPTNGTIGNLLSRRASNNSKVDAYADSEDTCVFDLQITEDGRTIERYVCIASRIANDLNPTGVVIVNAWEYLANTYPIITGGPSNEPCGKMSGFEKDTVGPEGNQTCYVPGGSSGSGGEGYPHWFLCIGTYCVGFYPGANGMLNSTGQILRDNEYLQDPATRCTNLNTPPGCDLVTFSNCLYNEMLAMQGALYSIFAPAVGNQCYTARQSVINRCSALCGR